MRAILIRRIATAIPKLLVVILLSFALMRAAQAVRLTQN